MRDIYILVAVYLVAAIFAIVGILGLLASRSHREPVREERVSTEDMLSGWGKEEEEGKA
ncbi:MAG: hypothetical protein AB7D92_04955 [Sphaerochaeta sp.]